MGGLIYFDRTEDEPYLIIMKMIYSMLLLWILVTQYIKYMNSVIQRRQKGKAQVKGMIQNKSPHQ